jgi:hypothetical protein
MELVTAAFPRSLAVRMANALRMPELRDELQRLGKCTDGRKNELVNSLVETWLTKRFRPANTVALPALRPRQLAAVSKFLPLQTFGSMSRVCKDLHTTLSESSVWTQVEANFYLVPAAGIISFARHLCKTRASLITLQLTIGSEEMPLILALFHLCDMSKLETAAIRTAPGHTFYFDHFNHANCNDAGAAVYAIDFTDDTAEARHQEGLAMNMTQERNIYRHMMELMQQRNSEERARGGNEIVFPPQHNCPRVEELLASCPLLRKLTLRPLDLNFNCAMPMVEELALIGGWAGAAMVDRLHDVVEEQLPSIKVLKLVGTPKHHLFLRFTSLSLEVIDLRDASKGSWIQRLNCPALREIVCIPTGYGNGLRPFIAAGPVLAPWERPANDLSFQCGINCDSFGAKLTQINMPLEAGDVVDAPAGCVVRILAFAS